ncbi:hypothetical protein MIND_00669500 [Mycena indigotica]|uniref:Uncharacterized protein n=1 Tax=Mycena indigotica TaxID=2126181 RepID=A0A8H6SKH0_9AGAR|nr:uncharacterized protein MIND_00669500 [Mycena indigotica]KAF7301056.1 hypothetical protein MIND_00669500 [Mycena indigotica]
MTSTMKRGLGRGTALPPNRYGIPTDTHSFTLPARSREAIGYYQSKSGPAKIYTARPAPHLHPRLLAEILRCQCPICSTHDNHTRFSLSRWEMRKTTLSPGPSRHK